MMMTDLPHITGIRPAAPHSRAGFTLVEMMVTSFISLLLIVGILGTFTQYRRTYSQKALEQERNQNLRMAMSQIQRDLRRCNSGMVMGMSSLGSWFPALSGATSLPYVIQGVSNRDTLITAGYTGGPVGQLALGTASGATSLSFMPDAGLVLPYSPEVGDVLVIGSVEALLVTSVSGNSIGFTTDPDSGTVGTHLSYPVGTEVYEVGMVKYSIGTYDGVTGLMREDSRFTYTNDGDKLVGLHIEELNVTQTNDQVTVELVGRTKAPLIAPLAGADGYIRERLSATHTLRNSDPELNISFWDTTILLTP
jgi:prepilin-type N-terminal cleavage/methylation domain-containing protein